MMPVELSHPIYNDEEAARKHLETIQWPDGPVCPYCGAMGKIITLGGDSMGPGWHHCGDCRRKFTVRVGTVYERSHIPLHKWMLAFRLMASSKKGMSSHQLSRTLDISYKSAWFLAHRIREAMKGTDPAPMGGEGKIIEADETLYGPKEHDPDYAKRRGWKGKPGYGKSKSKVVTLVERGGSARSFKVEDTTRATVQEILFRNASKESRLMTDESGIYPSIGLHFAKHESVKHGAGEYARGDVTTNTVEGFFSIFKRGMRGVYQHCGEQHLQRYLNEFDFRYSNRIAVGVDDAQRTELAIAAVRQRWHR